MRRKDLLDLYSLDRSEIEYLLDTAESFKEILWSSHRMTLLL